MIHVAYRCTFYGFIPFAGLLLGPVALGFGLLALYRYRGKPPEEVRTLTWWTVALSGLLTVTNWVGVWFMIQGLTG